MINPIDLSTVITRLEENDLLYGVLPLQDGIKILITERGGRVLGPFLDEETPSIYWLNPVLASADEFKAFLDADDWNLGAERVWVAPEVQYNITDRFRFDETFALPPQMDPCDFALAQIAERCWHLKQEMVLQAHVLAEGQKELHVERWIQPAANPLRFLSGFAELMHGLRFAGYEQIVSLTELAHDDIMSESWSSIMLNPGGVMLVPASPLLEYDDYREPIDGEHQRLFSNHVRLRITGDRRYKVGYKAVHLTGRLAYFSELGNGQSYLVVRNYLNNPSSVYVEEPPHLPGRKGNAVHVYNDGGHYGGFGELECDGQTIGGTTGRSTSTDQFLLWLYAGDTVRIGTIVQHLLGIDLHLGPPAGELSLWPTPITGNL